MSNVWHFDKNVQSHELKFAFIINRTLPPSKWIISGSAQFSAPYALQNLILMIVNVFWEPVKNQNDHHLKSDSRRLPDFRHQTSSNTELWLYSK